MAKPRKSYYWWIAGKVLYGLVGLGIFLMVAFLLWRILFSGNTPRNMERLSPNAALVEAFEAKGEALALRTQDHEIFTRGEDNNGYFSTPRVVYIPDAAQMQVLLRYNNSTLKATQKDFALEARPTKGEIVYDVTLLSITDQTPEDLSDNQDGSETLGEVRLVPTSYTVETTKLYTYILYTFDGVTFPEDVIVTYVDIYYGGAVDYANEAYGSIRVYHRDAPWIDLALSKDEVALLTDAKNGGNK